ncbi:MAG: chemotaxis protein CheD [Clostridia bacterium]|jgi:chemotaxis protein CheD|nr:chemotaxis protein CheD [Clostridia bacterium]
MLDTLQVVKVGMADLNLIKGEGMITTLGLGSCVGISLYDPLTKVAGMAHIMLPDSTQIKNNDNKFKFADTATVILIDKMIELGASKSRITAKLAGGAQMFSFANDSDIMKVGERNVIASKEALKKAGIKIIAEDTGKDYGRTIQLFAEDGKLIVKTIGKGTIEL